MTEASLVSVVVPGLPVQLDPVAPLVLVEAMDLRYGKKKKRAGQKILQLRLGRVLASVKHVD